MPTHCLFYFCLELTKKVRICLGWFIDGGIDKVFKCVGISEYSFSFWKSCALIEKLFFGKEAHALAVDG
jgi:hypothetical protein